MNKEDRIGFFNAISTWFASWRFISANGLAHYFLYPILISILLSMGAVVLIRKLVSYILDYITPFISHTPVADGTWWDKTLEVLSNVGTYAIAFLLWLLSIYIFNKFHKYIVLIIMSPVMALLSERTSEILTGKTIPFDGRQLVRDVVRGIGIAFRNLFVELFLGLVVWFAGIYLTIFIPPLGVLVAPVLVVISFLISAYFYGFSILDYSNERKKLSMAESIKDIRKNKGLAAGTGSLFVFWMMIPFIGVSIATITCTVAGTMAYERK